MKKWRVVREYPSSLHHSNTVATLLDEEYQTQKEADLVRLTLCAAAPSADFFLIHEEDPVAFVKKRNEQLQEEAALKK